MATNPATATASTPSATPRSTSTPSQNELSTGSKAGIGVACGLGIPIVALLCWLAFRRERAIARAKKIAQDPPPVYNGNASGAYDVKQGPVEATGQPMKHELGEGMGLEMSAGDVRIPQELPAERVRRK